MGIKVEFNPDLALQNAREQRKKSPQRLKIRDSIERNDLEIDSSTRDIIACLLKTHKHLSHVEVVFITPEEEPDTAGYFHHVRVDEKTFVPTIYLVSEDREHMARLSSVRQSSNAIVAKRLGIDPSQLSPTLLRQFIIAHELGHAYDYVINYETNPDYQGSDAAEEWDLHYESNLLTLPVPGLDPVDLREELSNVETLDDFLKEHPMLSKTINTHEIKTKQDLLKAQETAYRASVYEQYADTFAVDFLKQNADTLHIAELANPDQYRKAA